MHVLSNTLFWRKREVEGFWKELPQRIKYEQSEYAEDILNQS
jgi:hypothetical protein